MTLSQTAIKAWRKWKSGEYKSIRVAAINEKTTETNIKTVSYIVRRGSEDWIDEIFNGDGVVYGDGIKMSNNIFTIKAYFARKKASQCVNKCNKPFRKMTEEEIELLKKQIGSALYGVDPLDVKIIADHIYSIIKEK